MNKPMEMLRDKAEDTLMATTRELGAVQKSLQHAIEQHQQLQNYALEYQQSLRLGISGRGMSMANLTNHQAFIGALNHVVKQHEMHIERCEGALATAKARWINDKQRLNAFETLIVRRQYVERVIDRRQDQKLMDTFAQRAGQKRAQ